MPSAISLLGLSYLNSSSHRFSISTEETMLPRHARCVLSRLRYNGHYLLLSSHLSRIGRSENPSCSACGHSSQDTFYLILHCPATHSFAPLALWRLSGSDPEELPGFWGSMVFRHAPIPRKRVGKQQQQQHVLATSAIRSVENFTQNAKLCFYFCTIKINSEVTLKNSCVQLNKK